MYSTEHFKFSDQCIDMLFNNLLDGDLEKEEDGWTLFTYLLSFVTDINRPLSCGKYKGESFLYAATKEENVKMRLLIQPDELSNTAPNTFNKKITNPELKSILSSIGIDKPVSFMELIQTVGDM